MWLKLPNIAYLFHEQICWSLDVVLIYVCDAYSLNPLLTY